MSHSLQPRMWQCLSIVGNKGDCAVELAHCAPSSCLMLLARVANRLSILTLAAPPLLRLRLFQQSTHGFGKGLTVIRSLGLHGKSLPAEVLFTNLQKN